MLSDALSREEETACEQEDRTEDVQLPFAVLTVFRWLP
jgi:hypothetical protein